MNRYMLKDVIGTIAARRLLLIRNTVTGDFTADSDPTLGFTI
jgi:hypothetical protein